MKSYVGYCKDPKFSDRQIWANNVDPYDTAQEQSVCIFWIYYCIVKPLISNFRIITVLHVFSGVLQIFIEYTYLARTTSEYCIDERHDGSLEIDFLSIYTRTSVKVKYQTLQTLPIQVDES